ncbi:MAG TPA: hypothetical protein VN519_03410 [Bryobacteraceae bacterium]|nr:hypothetical protein [Bryobacteraceae bacterium]
MQDGSAPGWREVMEQRLIALIEEVGARVEAQVASEVARAVGEEHGRAEARMASEVARAVNEEKSRAEAQTAQAASAQAEAARALAEAQAEAMRVLNDAQAEAMRALRALNEEKERSAEESRRRLSESLNQTLRRIRQTRAEHETLQLVLEESAFCAARAVVLLVESGRLARVAVWRDVTLRGDEEDSAPIDLQEAGALASCVTSGDPMAALASPGEISSVLASAFGKGGEDKVYLFPVRVRQTTVALIVAGGGVSPAPLELLCEAAGMRLEALDAAAPPAAASAAEKSDLVHIAGVRNGTPARSWESLSGPEQALHLKAQRTARVRVAQIRISEAPALRKGMQERDIYQALRRSLDAARGEFRQNYMTQTPGMVDYLHLEIVRSLAQDDEKLLGTGYPGPMA